MSAILRSIFASSGDMLIPALAISCEGQETIRVVSGYEDLVVPDETGQTVTFLKSSVRMELPGSDNTGAQALSFAIDNVQGEAQDFLFKAIETGKRIQLRFYTYVESDLSGPVEPPGYLSVTGSSIVAGRVSVTGMHLDLLNIMFPRAFYDTFRFPCIQFSSVSNDL